MNQTRQAPDCFEAGPDLLPVREARRRILAGLTPRPGSERVPLSEALGRVLAADVVALFDVPPHTNSAMDGYAVSAQDLPDGDSTALRVVGTSRAGHPFAGTVGLGQAVDITTGAQLPDGTDTVVIQENVSLSEDIVTVGPGNTPGQNVRAAGEDIATGDTVIATGQRIGPAEWGVVASLGLAEVDVRPRLRVAVLSTGDELRDAGQPLSPGAIYDSNRFLLRGMLAGCGAEVIDLGIVRDDPGRVRHALDQAAQSADVIITSAGISTGQADYVSETLREHGELTVWRIAIRPGRPFAQGRYGDAVLFGLPGNPVAVVVTFCQFVQPALRCLMGESELDPVPIVDARCVSRLRKKPGRTEIYRAILERDDAGTLTVRSTGRQGSGLLTSIVRANCFVLLPDDTATVEPGTVVPVQPFRGLF